MTRSSRDPMEHAIRCPFCGKPVDGNSVMVWDPLRGKPYVVEAHDTCGAEASKGVEECSKA